jgi:hypothetical protein
VDAPVIYVLDALFRDGSRERVGSRSFRFQPPLPVSAVGQNHPNPFRRATAIPVQAAPGRAANVLVFDTRGRLVHTLRPSLSPGESVVHWNGRDAAGRLVPAGTYFYRLEGTPHTLKMIRRP